MGKTAGNSVQVGSTKIHYFPASRIGTSSLVFRGFYDDPSIQAAIKKIKKDDVEVYQREKAALINIKSDSMRPIKNIVLVHEWIEHKDYYYLVTEKADYNLRDFLKEHQTLERNIKVQIIQDIANGIDYLHEKNILHRDINPKNVLIFGEKYVAKLGDFGVSRKMSNENSTNSEGRGTLNWMPPEAITAKNNDQQFETTKYVDVFSFGMTAYFTLSNGKHPFRQSTQFGTDEISNIIDPIVQPVQLIEQSKCFNTCHLLAWMMQKVPKDRPIILQITSHPMFWDYRKCLDFICRLSKIVNDKHTKECKQIRDKIELEYESLHQALYHENLDWKDKIDQQLLERTGKGKKKYYSDSLFSLVELIRDKDAHFKEMLPRLVMTRFRVTRGTTWGYSDKLYMRYYKELFPDIVIFLFCSFVDQKDPYFASFREIFYEFYEDADPKFMKKLLLN